MMYVHTNNGVIHTLCRLTANDIRAHKSCMSFILHENCFVTLEREILHVCMCVCVCVHIKSLHPLLFWPNAREDSARVPHSLNWCITSYLFTAQQCMCVCVHFLIYTMYTRVCLLPHYFNSTAVRMCVRVYVCACALST